MPRLNYTKINWENAPSTNTPITAENLDHMDNGLAALYADVGELESAIGSHVGQIIFSTTLDTEEKVLAKYGGTHWSKMEGVFLLGASDSYPAGSTGGRAHGYLLEHSHTFTYTDTNSSTSGGTYNVVGGNNIHIGMSHTDNKHGTTAVEGTNSGNTNLNMPPYKAVYIWERTE